jgi:hypothetical protein
MATIHGLFKSALLAMVLTATVLSGHLENMTSKALASSSQAAKDDSDEGVKLSPEERMQRRFPQPVRVGFLIGRPVIDNDDNTLGYVQRVVRTPDGKIELIVRYGGWFGWIGWWQRPVAVPIELVAMLGPFVAAVDFFPDDFRKAPTWEMPAGSKDIGPDDTIRVALTKR